MSEGRERFEKYFSAVYGERWTSLRESLLKPAGAFWRENRFARAEGESRFSKLTKNDWGWSGPAGSTLVPERSETNLLDVYGMDMASVYPARALMCEPGDRVLDVCAAPGGKTLCLAEDLFARGDTRGELISNDMSPERRERLTKVIQQYIPREVRDRVWVTGKDGVKFGLQKPGEFNRVLLDAPCSGEAHLLENEKEMALWSPRRSENLAVRQYSLLSAALLAVSAGGRLVYSTCSISPLENDDVIAKLVKKKGDAVSILSEGPWLQWPESSSLEKTKHGWIFLPDRGGLGPIYFAVVEKRS